MKLELLAVTLLLAPSAVAQQFPSVAEITAPDLDAFSEACIEALIKALPGDQISDRAIRVVDMGGHDVGGGNMVGDNTGIFAVFCPQTQQGRAIQYDTSVSEIYYLPGRQWRFGNRWHH